MNEFSISRKYFLGRDEITFDELGADISSYLVSGILSRLALLTLSFHRNQAFILIQSGEFFGYLISKKVTSCANYFSFYFKILCRWVESFASTVSWERFLASAPRAIYNSKHTLSFSPTNYEQSAVKVNRETFSLPEIS